MIVEFILAFMLGFCLTLIYRVLQDSYMRKRLKLLLSRKSKAKSCPHFWEDKSRRTDEERTFRCPSIDLESSRLTNKTTVLSYKGTGSGIDLVYEYLENQQCPGCRYWAMSADDVAVDILTLRRQEQGAAEYNEILTALDGAMAEVDRSAGGMSEW